MGKITLYKGDCLEEMKNLPDNSVDSIVTDPPYGLSFMGKKWDYDVPSQEIWKECIRVLKPGGYLLSFAGTRTQHRMAVNIEDAGFEIRDMIAWVYGSGFPKSLNIGKSVDKLQGNEREKSTYIPNDKNKVYGKGYGGGITDTSKGTSDWEGWGTALKPALEPITVARKPFKGTVAKNVLKWGTGGINIDGSRVEYSETNKPIPQLAQDKREIKTNKGMYGGSSYNESKTKSTIGGNLSGRFPANFIHDGSDEVVELFPNGSARFFYCAKASKKERNKGCEGLEEKIMGRNQSSLDGGQMLTGSGNIRSNVKKNNHPTVKPLALMEYLVNLVTPPNGTVLDPFMGSGTTGIACKKLGYDFIGIELDKEYFKIAEERIKQTTTKESLSQQREKGKDEQ